MGLRKTGKETFKVDKFKEFSKWYNSIIREADLVDDRYNVKGFIVHKPWSMVAFKHIYRIYEEALERRGHLPVLFPTLIPEENFVKEAAHVEGFKAEVFWVTHGADRRLRKRLALRPTSETAFYQMYALWIRSYTDLPVKTYQSCTVFRYETKATKPLMRGREFLWIEAHDAFADEQGAYTQVAEDMEIAEEVIYGKLGIPFIFFQRAQWDKFAGGVNTYAADCLMPDGKLNQVASTHYLGQNFSKAFQIQFVDGDGFMKYVHQTCYGPGIWRIMAALIAIHGDDDGLILPFILAPVQVVIIPIRGKGGKEERILETCKALAEKLKAEGVRVELDLSEKTPGAKYYYWEMKGVPVRLEVGIREVAGGFVTLFRRDTRSREKVKVEDLPEGVWKAAESINQNLRERADRYLTANIREAQTLEQLVSVMREKGGIVKVPFCTIELGGRGCADRIRQETGAEVRGTRFPHEEHPAADAKCVICGRKAEVYVYVANAY